jgi:selenide,water dikinase
VLRQLPPIHDPNLLVGPNTSDDAAVYRLSEDLAIIQTVDFFTPVVDDPYLFGQIAAANSLSDIYAMGGRPLLALNIVCFPNCLDPGVLGEILRGGADKVAEAGAIIAGGHTVQDNEPKYGLAVTGLVHPGRVRSNAGALPGDILVLTKPLGSGIINTAAKGDLASQESIKAAVENMSALNHAAAEAMAGFEAGACTDITGFGLLGHAAEMAGASNVSLEIWSGRLPLLPGALDMAAMGMIPAGAYANRDFLAGQVRLAESVSPELAAIMYDPQTSGGLLISVPEKLCEGMLKLMNSRGVQAVAVGRALKKGELLLEIL